MRSVSTRGSVYPFVTPSRMFDDRLVRPRDESIQALQEVVVILDRRNGCMPLPEPICTKLFGVE